MYPSENTEGKEISDLVSQNILRATYQFTIIIVLFNSAVCAKFSFKPCLGKWHLIPHQILNRSHCVSSTKGLQEGECV